jgi:hypothetical protein
MKCYAMKYDYWISLILVGLIIFELIIFSDAWGSAKVPTTAHHRHRRAFLQELRNLITKVSTASFVNMIVDVPYSNAKNLPDTSNIDTSKIGTTETLDPILNLRQRLEELYVSFDRGDDKQVTLLLATIPKSEQSFKAIFDAYSDPVSYKQRFVDQNAFLVYYTKGFDGPGRPSIESDLPVKQTLQYGARNDAWIAWNDFLVEMEYQRNTPQESDAKELLKLIRQSVDAVDKYLQVSEVKLEQEL